VKGAERSRQTPRRRGNTTFALTIALGIVLVFAVGAAATGPVLAGYNDDGIHTVVTAAADASPDRAGPTTLTFSLHTATQVAGPASVRGSRSSTSPISMDVAAKGARIPQVGEGIVYRRTSRTGGKPYIGQSKSGARYDARQLEHQRDNPFDAFDYEIVGRSNPGSQLDRLEEFFIRQGGGPTTRRNPAGGLANRRHQMRDERYEAAGGGF